MRIFPITGSAFSVETQPGQNGTVQLVLTTSSLETLTAAGTLAVLNQVYTYLNTTVSSQKNLATVLRQVPAGTGAEIHVTASGASYPVLTSDVAGQVSALTTIVQAVANVGVN
ncbi:hypothetical protein [Frankia sp. AgW1.1]|uniref:hypothetical protein n=1 Tax=Frankia sp. AgW1.1 TaxID=1836971 RepID=UPI001933B01E|nr:hypothetical protein [Frankia sp. AgW1.1]MBL7487093.1 hypothetical protein [Frankia sp. AgW1.1]